MNENCLWFAVPAASFTESCPVGNGRLGGMLFGGVAQERIVLNESTVWSGGPQEADRPEAHRMLPEIRRLLVAGKNPEAEALVNRTFVCQGAGSGHGKGKDVPFGCYQILGELCLTFAHAETPADYRRELDLNTAVAGVAYRAAGTAYRRAFWASAPAQVLVLRLTADRPAAIAFEAVLSRPERAAARGEGNDLLLEGQLPNGMDGRGVRFQARLGVRAEGGAVSVRDGRLCVTGADAATLFIAAGTSFRSADFAETVRAQLAAAASQPYAALRRAHEADYRSFSDRVRLSLPSTPNSALPMPERLAGFAAGAADPALAALLFQYGRYLLISSSRPDSPLPANLQGLWAEELQTPWNGDFHLDINVQMNYWPAGPAGLVDCQLPLVRLIEGLVAPGRKTARAYYNARGWVAHVITNPWGFTAPGESAAWGATCSGSAWLCAHLWEHYQFTGDREYLARVYPVLRESAQFFLDMLIEEPAHGWLVTAPSTSPENPFRLPDGRPTHLCLGATIDVQLLRELFANVGAAAEALGIDAEFRAALDAARARLPPLQIGRHGQLQEWLEDYEEADPHHRHTSHLYGLHPSDQITASAPALFQAARVSLDRRGDDTNGWALAWRTALWARLLDGERAFRLLRALLKPVTEAGFRMDAGGGVYPNLFCAHPPFQIDGNFGGCAAIVEMLLQSHERDGDRRLLRLLPALPSAWPDGRVEGLYARDGVRMDLSWAGGLLASATLHGFRDQTCVVRYRDACVTLSLKAGESLRLGPDLSVRTPGFPHNTFHGFRRHDFRFGDNAVVVVEPHHPTPGRRWVWKAEFFESFPAFDLAMLDQGWWIGYLTVGNTFGCPDAMRRFDAFYREMTEAYGFHRRPVLEGMSRGGLYVYNWAVDNVDKVGMVYADNAVCDFKSWPGGKGRGPGSAVDWTALQACYHFASEADALAWPRNPVDNVAPLVRAGIPLVHSFGDADEIVPWEENTKILAERVKALGGAIKLYRKIGGKHHPHGPEDPRSFVKWVLENTLP